jgi:pimeloyl-ACP methyl ester carboxylesterase
MASDQNRGLAQMDTPADDARLDSPCSIILVHGTRVPGFVPKRREVSLYPPNKRWWFEEGSQFRTGLDAALKSASLDWTICPFLWSGANSVHARDRAARELSDQLRKALQDDPAARAVIIAHSHGGNVALRALQHLNSMAGQIRVITLATPFLRVFARRSFQLPLMVSILVSIGIAMILVGLQWIILSATGLSDIPGAFRFIPSGTRDIGDVPLALLLTIALGTVAAFFIGDWLLAIHTNTQAALAIEEAATYDTKDAASRMLVIRGVDDEAALGLAAGSIGSRLGYLVLAGVIPTIVLVLSFAPLPVVLFYPSAVGPFLFSVLLGVQICAPIFLVLPGVIESIFFGREFLVNALVCDIAVDSVPDTSGQVEAITLIPVELASSKPAWTSYMLGLEFKLPYKLPSEPYSLLWWSEMMRILWRELGKGELLKLKGRWRLSSWQLRHGIYNHPNCVDEIARWLRRVT